MVSPSPLIVAASIWAVRLSRAAARRAHVSFFVFFLSTVSRVSRQPDRERGGRTGSRGRPPQYVGTVWSCDSLLQGAPQDVTRAKFAQYAVAVSEGTSTAKCCANFDFQLSVKVTPVFGFRQRCR